LSKDNNFFQKKSSLAASGGQKRQKRGKKTAAATVRNGGGLCAVRSSSAAAFLIRRRRSSSGGGVPHIRIGGGIIGGGLCAAFLIGGGVPHIRIGGGIIGGGLWHICSGSTPSAPTRTAKRGAGSSSRITLFDWNRKGVERVFFVAGGLDKTNPQTAEFSSSRAERFRRILFYENTMMLDISR